MFVLAADFQWNELIVPSAVGVFVVAAVTFARWLKRAVGRWLDRYEDAGMVRKLDARLARIEDQLTPNGMSAGAATAGKGLREAIDTGVTQTVHVQKAVEDILHEQAAIMAAVQNAVARDDARFATVDRRLDDQAEEYRRNREVLRDHSHPAIVVAVDRLREDVMGELEQIRGDIVALYERTES